MSRPTPTGLAFVLGTTALLVWALLGVVGVGLPAQVGLATAALFAGSLWALGRRRYEAVGVLAASLTAPLVGLGLVAAGVGSVAALAVGAMPVSGPGLLRSLVVRVAAGVVVVAGCTTAAFGAIAATRAVIEPDAVRQYSSVTLQAAAPPFVAGGALFVAGLVRYFESNPGPGLQQVAGDLLEQVLDPVFAPAPGRTHLFVFVAMLGVTAFAAGRAVAALPVAELLPDTADAPDVAPLVSRVEGVLTLVASVAVLGSAIVAVFEASIGQSRLAALLPPGGYELLVAVTAAPALRMALWWLLVGSTVVAGVAWSLQRTARTSADRVAVALAPSVGGGLVAVGAAAVAAPVAGVVRGAVADAPAPVGTVTERFVFPVVEFYGPETVLLLLTVVVVLVPGGLAGLLWLALASRYVAADTAGVAIAAAGLFVASAFAAAVGGSVPLVLSGLVGAFLVWDAGAFGTTLAREAGRDAATRRTELVHDAGTLAVGTVGAGLAVALYELGTGSLSLTPGPALAGLAAALLAVVAFVAALW